MSFQAMAWAVQHRLPVKEKITLLILANYASNKDGDCYPSLGTLADDTGLSKDSVIRAIKELEDAGLLSVNRRQVEGVNLPNSYRLNLATSSQKLQGVVAGSGEGSRTQRGGVVAGCDSNLSPEPVIDPEKHKAPAAQRAGSTSDVRSITLPDFLERDLWNAFVDHRRALKKPLTLAAAELIMKKLEGFERAGLSSRAALEASIENGWQGVFEPKPQPGRGLSVSGVQQMPQSKTGQALLDIQRFRDELREEMGHEG